MSSQRTSDYWFNQRYDDALFAKQQREKSKMTIGTKRDEAAIPVTTHPQGDGTVEFGTPDTAVAYARGCAFAVNTDDRGRYTASRDDMPTVEYQLRQQESKRWNVRSTVYYWRRNDTTNIRRSWK